MFMRYATITKFIIETHLDNKIDATGHCKNQVFPEMSWVSSIAYAVAENWLKIQNVQISGNSTITGKRLFKGFEVHCHLLLKRLILPPETIRYL